MFNTKNFDFVKENNLFIKPIGSDEKTYLYLNPAIVQLFYNLRRYSQLNISSYVNSLLHCNNVIGLDYQSKIGLSDIYLNYEVAVEESNKALNEFNSLIYNLPSTIIAYTKFNNSVKILHQLLNRHIQDMDILFKNKNKITDITIDTMPDNFYDNEHNIKPNDMKTRDYISVYNMY